MNAKKPKISIIVALSQADRTIGRQNGLIWKISLDLKRFKALTTNHPIIMGRKTFDSIGRSLPNRTNIIITRQNIEFPNAIVVNNLSQAISEAEKVESDEIFIIGGGEIYRQSLDLADKLYLTLVKTEEKGDVFFPEYSHIFTNEKFRDEHPEHDPPFTFINLEK